MMGNGPEKTTEIKQSPAEVTKENGKKTTEAIKKNPNQTDGANAAEKVKNAKKISETIKNSTSSDELFHQASLSRKGEIGQTEMDNFLKLKSKSECAYKAYQIGCALPMTDAEAKYLNTIQITEFTYPATDGKTYSVKTLSGLFNYLALKNSTITKDRLPDIKKLKNEMINLRRTTIIDIYAAKKIPGIMPIPQILATGDGSGTKGINGQSNVGRWAFEYGDKISETNNKVIFGLQQDNPMIIKINAFGENTNLKNSGGKMALTFKKESQQYTIDGTYLNGVITLQKNPKLNDITIQGTKVIIPARYKDWDISINTQSNGSPITNNDGTTKMDENGKPLVSYDEIAFAATVDNGHIGTPTISGKEFGKGNAEVNNQLGEYGVDGDNVRNLTKEVLETAKRTAINSINMNIKVQADDTLHDASNVQKYTDGYTKDKKNIPGYTTLLNSLSSQKLKDVVTNFKKKIDLMTSVFSSVIKDKEGNPITEKKEIDIQNKAQKLLIMNRFISTIIAASQDNPDFIKMVERGKIKINPSFEATPKGSEKGAKITISDYVITATPTPVKKIG